MAFMENRRMSFVADVDEALRFWTVKVQVVESHRSQERSGRNGGQTKTYKRYLLVDEHGTKISAIVYEEDIRYFSNSLQPFKRYLISNARLIQAFAFFRVGPYGFTWVIKNNTPVELIDEPNVPNLPFSYTVCSFNEFVNHADIDTGFNVKGIVVHAFPRRQVSRESSHREFVIVDESKRPTILTMWNSYGDVEGNMIASSVANNPIIIGVNIKSTTFHGLSLGTRMYSCILVDPPLAETPTMKQWFTNNKAEIMKMVNDRAYKNTDLLLPPPALSDAIDVPTAVATLNTINSAWVAGQIHFTVSRQQYYMCACANCHKKANTGHDWYLRCSSSDHEGEVELRCRVPVELIGGDRSLHVVLTSPDVERLTGVAAQQLRDAYEFDLNVDDELQVGLDKQQVVCFVKKYDRPTMGNLGCPGVRYTVVKTYTVSALTTAPALPPPSLDVVTQEGSTDEEQLFTPNTMKKLTNIDGINVAGTCADAGPSAKRGLDFISAEIDKDGAAVQGPNVETDQSLAGNETEAVEKSPAKKTRDKLKMN